MSNCMWTKSGYHLHFQHPFIDREVDVKYIRDLLLEYKAEVVEEDVEEDADVSIWIRGLWAYKHTWDY